MTKAQSKTLTVEIGPRHTTYITEGGHIVPVLNTLGIPRQWHPGRRCWAIPTNRADDLLAYCEHKQKRAVNVQAGDR